MEELLDIDELFARFQGRFRRLIQELRDGDEREWMKRWEETNDVLNEAALRFWSSTATSEVRTKADFVKFMATQIRWTIMDRSKKLRGKEGIARNHHSDGNNPFGTDQSTPRTPVDPVSGQPQAILNWTEFHEQIGNLPDGPREVLELKLYGGLSASEIAEQLGVDKGTIYRRLRTASAIMTDYLESNDSAESE